MRETPFVIALFTTSFLLGLNGCPPSPDSPADVYVNDVAFEDTCTNEEAGQVDAAWVSEDDLDNVKDGAIRYPVCKSACDNLKKLGCIESKQLDGGQDCYSICAHAESTRKFDLHPACVANAKTVDAVRACGPIRCGK